MIGIDLGRAREEIFRAAVCSCLLGSIMNRVTAGCDVDDAAEKFLSICPKMDEF